MPLDASSYAAAVGAAVNNVQFQPAALNKPRKICIIGTPDPTLESGITEDEPVLITSAEYAGSIFGFGFMIHRLAQKVFAGSQGIECWVVPQFEAPEDTNADGDLTLSGTATEAGNIYLYIAGDLVRVPVAVGDTAASVMTAVAAAVNADNDLPVTAAYTTLVTFTSKSGGEWGNDITLNLNLGFEQELPAGITAVIDSTLTTGVGLPDIEDALDNGLGQGDDQNEKDFTAVQHGYGQDSTTLGLISTYNGIGNDYVGNYSKTVARPFRSLVGDNVAGASGLSDLITLGDGRKETDRTTGCIAVPGSANHPSEIAALAMGIMERINNNRAAEHYVGQVLDGIWAGARADRWTRDYDDRNTAVLAGISPTIVENDVVKMQNVLTFYHPVAVPITSNGYRSQRNISIIQNLLYNIKLNFSQAKWQGISIVDDVAEVSNATDREKAKDVGAVIDDLVALTNSFEDKAWIFTAAFTLGKLAEGGYVTIRAGGTGFDSTLPVILSGEGSILDTVVQFDTSLAVLL